MFIKKPNPWSFFAFIAFLDFGFLGFFQNRVNLKTKENPKPKKTHQVGLF